MALELHAGVADPTSTWAFNLKSVCSRRLIFGGVFDQFHLFGRARTHGEGVPSFCSASTGAIEANASPPSEYFRDNFHVTTSGMPPIGRDGMLRYLMPVGADRMLFAVDYPFNDLANARECLLASSLPSAISSRSQPERRASISLRASIVRCASARAAAHPGEERAMPARRRHGSDSAHRTAADRAHRVVTAWVTAG